MSKSKQQLRNIRFNYILATSVIYFVLISIVVIDTPDIWNHFVESGSLSLFAFCFFLLILLYIARIKSLPKDPIIYMLVTTIVFMMIILLITIFSENVGIVIEKLLGSQIKKDTIKFIAFGIVGILAIINAVLINRRTYTQENKNDDYRFQHLTNNLGHKKSTVRVASFNRFYYLALKDEKKEDKKLIEDIFEILCSTLRVMSSGAPLAAKERHEYLTESQILFDILFKGKFKSNSQKKGLVNNDPKSDLRNVHFVGIDFSDANLSNADFREANFSREANLAVNLHDVYWLDGADFKGAKINGHPIQRGDLPSNKGKYKI